MSTVTAASRAPEAEKHPFEPPLASSSLETLYLAAWATLMVAAMLGTPELPATLVRQRLWAFQHLRGMSIAVRVGLSILAVLACVPQVRGRVAAILASILAKARGFPAPRGATLLLPVLSFPLFWLLRQRNFNLGDAEHLIQVLTRDVHTRGYHLTFDEPLELYLHSAAYRWLHAAFGWRVEDAYALLSALSGVGFVAIAAALFKGTGRARRLVALGLIGASGIVQLFFGYVENYTLVATGILLYVLLAWRYLEGRCRLAWPALVLGSSVCLHVLSGWLFPSLLYLCLAGARTTRDRLKNLATAALAVIVPVAATVGFCAWLGVSPAAIKATHLWRMKFIFLIDPSDRMYKYPMLSGAHVVDVLNELVLAALPGVIALGWIGVFHRREVVSADPMLRFLALVAVFVQLFSVSWNSELGAYLDWDLFGFVGFGYGLLSAWILARQIRSEASVRHAGGAIIVLALCSTGPWVVGNHRQVVQVDSRHDAAHVALARMHAANGDVDEAMRNYLEAIRANADNPEAHFGLGAAYHARGQSKQARRHLLRYLELDPDGVAAEQARSMLEH